ncbi:hypothetical protein K7432_016670 [Basidiobolus ranarum]|uniref:Carrier domain-containing protein n=1 Tax=Basidiobolus ranarum TaxID=34480 RepID=A0ABR2WED6_9FUNG
MAFVTNDFDTDTRIYRTGDLALFNEDGTVRIVGRMDNQIKLNGLRIELDEIEHALQEHSKVTRACVIPLVTDESTKHKSLTAFITFHELVDSNLPVYTPGGPNSGLLATYVKEVRSLIRKKLPSYMIPTIWVPLNRMPFTTSEKIDRKSLASLYATLSKEDLLLHNISDDAGHVRARTEVEKSWVKLWSSVLKIPAAAIGVHDSFVNLGGDSVLAIRLVGAAHMAGFTLSVQDVYLHPTIAEMANNSVQIDCNIHETKEIEKYSLLNLDQDQLKHLLECDLLQNGICPADVHDIYPCSPMQEGLVALSMKENSIYLTQQVYKCESCVDIERLRTAWKTVIDANPILRTAILFTTSGFAHLNGLQVVLRGESVEWNIHEYEDINALENGLEKALVDDRSRGILIGQPLTRFTLVKIRGTAVHFIWTIHHALYDGWSMEQIVSDVVTAYQGHSLTIRPTYTLYINHILNQDKQQSLKYWKATLSSAPATNLARSVSILTETPILSRIYESIHVDFTSVTGIYNITAATISYLAWALVLKSHIGSSDIVFGVVNSGRSIPLPYIQDICGPCITTFPTRITLSDDQSILDILRLIQSTQVQQHQYQSVGLQDILKLCGDTVESPLFDTLLVVQNINQDSGAGGFATIGLNQSAVTMPIDYPIVIEINTNGTAPGVSLTYDEQAVTEFEASWIVRHFIAAINVILNNVNTPVRDVSIKTDEEIALIEAWSRINYTDTKSGCLHKLFEHSVLIHPDKIAIQFEDLESVTYEELNRRANQLAHHLINVGVGPESMVPLCLDKSVPMIVAMLAVLKAGGAYVPLDPNNPVERNRFILAEIDAKVALTSDQYKLTFDKQILLVLVDSDDEHIQQHSTSNPQVDGLTSSNLCYVLFTSGSTGIPKGVIPAVRQLHF